MPRQSGIAGAETQNTSGINHSGLYKKESAGLYGDKVVTNLGNQQVAPSKQYQNGGGNFESPAVNAYQDRSPLQERQPLNGRTTFTKHHFNEKRGVDFKKTAAQMFVK